MDNWTLNGNADTNPETNFVGTTDEKALSLRTNGVEAIHIESGQTVVIGGEPQAFSGKVGIGVGAPETSLHVSGDRIRLSNKRRGRRLDLRTDGGAVDVQSETNSLFIRSNGPDGNNNVLINPLPRQGDGNVGIGTTNPAAKLHVEGPLIVNTSATPVNRFQEAVVFQSAQDSPTLAVIKDRDLASGPALRVVKRGRGGFAAEFIVGDENNEDRALQVRSSARNFAAEFQSFGALGKGIHIVTRPGRPGLEVSGGTKSALVSTSNGTRTLYTEEATQVWFADYGFGCAQKGRVEIEIDPLFAETVNLDEPYHVFVQPYSSASLYVTNRTSRSFEVCSPASDQDVEFSYRLVAKRKGCEGLRLEHAPWADDDRRVYSETRDEFE